MVHNVNAIGFLSTELTQFRNIFSNRNLEIVNQNHKIQYNPQLSLWTKCEKQKRMKRNSQIDPTQYYEKNESKS